VRRGGRDQRAHRVRRPVRFAFDPGEAVALPGHQLGSGRPGFQPSGFFARHGRLRVPTAEKVSRFLYVPPDTPMETFASPGIGQSLRFRTPDRVGSALALEDVVVHLQLFPSNGQSRQAHGFTRMAGPSQRGPRY